MREALLISKPIAPPWTDSNKNLVRDLARGLTRTRARVMVPEGSTFEGAVSEPVYRAAGAYAPSRAANARVLARLITGPRADVWHFFFAPNPLTLSAEDEKTWQPGAYRGISLWGHFPESLTLGSKLGQMGRGLASLGRKEHTVGAPA